MRLATSYRHAFKLILLFTAICLLTPFTGSTRTLLAQRAMNASGMERCFAVSDGYLDEDAVDHTDQMAQDTLVYLDFLSGETGAVESSIPNMFSLNVEAIAFQPGAENLYAADADQLAVLHLETATFTPRSNTFGNAQGYL